MVPGDARRRVGVTLFVDSGVFFAAATTDDRDNRLAKSVLRNGEAIVTTDHVIVETWMLLRSRVGRVAADVWCERVRAATSGESVRASDLEWALRAPPRYARVDYSLVDRTSLAVIERLGLTRVATFDDDFAAYRSPRARHPSLEIVL